MELLKVKVDIPQKLEANDNPTYEEWMRRVDHFIFDGYGLSVNDLPDCNFFDWYQQRMRPIRAANRALKYAQMN